MSEKADVLILGGGIASAGLAFNLARAGFKGRVVVLDRDRIGSSGAYGYRNTFREVVEEYVIPYKKVFRGLRDAITTEDSGISWLDVDIPCYFYDYREACESLFSRSQAEILVGEAIGLDPAARLLKLRDGDFGFGTIVDCSGPRGWSRALLGLPKISRFYIGKTYSMPISEADGMPPFFDETRFIYYTEHNGYMEDVYALGDELLFGVWDYSPNPFPTIAIRRGGILSSFGSFEAMTRCRAFPAVISAEPVYPIAYGPVAYLGDSCGQATPASSEGTRPILEASRLLAEVLASGKPLAAYQTEWFRRNAWSYSLHRAMKRDLAQYNKFFAKIRNYPDIYRDLALNRNPRIPIIPLLSSFPYLATSFLSAKRNYTMHVKNSRLHFPIHE